MRKKGNLGANKIISFFSKLFMWAGAALLVLGSSPILIYAISGKFMKLSDNPVGLFLLSWFTLTPGLVLTVYGIILCVIKRFLTRPQLSCF
jgi:hypothetical protein